MLSHKGLPVNPFNGSFPYHGQLITHDPRCRQFSETSEMDEFEHIFVESTLGIGDHGYKRQDSHRYNSHEDQLCLGRGERARASVQG